MLDSRWEEVRSWGVRGARNACSIIYLPPSTYIDSRQAYHLMVSIVAFLSNEDKKSSSQDMGERSPICGGVWCFLELSAAKPAHDAMSLETTGMPIFSTNEHGIIAVNDDFGVIDSFQSSLGCPEHARESLCFTPLDATASATHVAATRFQYLFWAVWSHLNRQSRIPAYRSTQSNNP